MRSNRTVLIVLAALCLSAAGFALWPIFGPDAAAMARRDDLRLGDLRQLESRVECIAHFDDGTLPSAITPNENCPATSEPTDPGTGAPYT